MAVTNHLLLADNADLAFTPDDESQRITGDIDIRADVALDDWTPAGRQTLVAKVLGANNEAYALIVAPAGTLLFQWSDDGTTTLGEFSTTGVSVSDGDRIAVRATLDVDDGSGQHVVTFYTAETIDATWEQLGNAITNAGTTTIFPGTADLWVGDNGFIGNEHALGKFYDIEVRDGIGGTIVAKPQFTDQAPGATGFVGAADETWTLQGGAELVGNFSPLSATVDIVVERARRDMLLASRGPAYTLGSDYTADGTTLTLAEMPSHIGQGSILSVDYEIFYVQQTNTGSKSVTVIPGYGGTARADHDQGSVVQVDSRAPKSHLLEYALEEILSWGNELWRVTTVDVDVVANQRTYNLDVTGDIYFLLDARLKPIGSNNQFWFFSWTGDAWPHADARLLREMSTSEFAAGRAIQLTRYPTKATTLRVALAQPFDLSTFESNTDLVTQVGLRREWLDIVELGVKRRAASSLMQSRSDWRVGNMARDDQAVSVLDTMRTATFMEDMRQRRFAKAAVDLRAEWPYRRTS